MENDFENIFRASTPPCLVLQPQGPNYFIVDANDVYLEITGTSREALVGKRFRDAFPKKPNLEYYGSELLLESFNRVVLNRQRDITAPLRYDLPISGCSDFTEKYWRPENVPVFNEKGEVERILHSLQEVTEQVLSKKNEWLMRQELMKNKQQYWHFVERNTDGLFSLDMEGNFTSANQGLADIVGVPLEELLNINFLPFCAPENRELVQDHFQRAIKGESSKFEANFISGNGKKMVLEVSLMPTYIYGGTAGAYGIAKDMTNFRESEKILVKKRNFLQANANFISSLLHNNLEPHALQEAMAMIGKAVEVDRIYYFDAYTHKDSEEVYISQKIEWTSDNASPQIDNPELQDMPASKVHQMLGNLEKNEPFSAVPSELAEGELKELLLDQGIQAMLLLPIFLEHKLYGFIGFDDCTRERQWEEREIRFLRCIADNLTNTLEKKAAEAAVKEREEVLRRSQQKFRALVQEGSDLIGILGSDGTYEFASETTFSILGFAPSEFLGKSPAEFVHPDDLPQMKLEYAAIREKKQIQLSVFRFKAKSGGWRWLKTKVTDLTHDPAVGGIVINCRDVTDLIDQEREIELISERSIAAITAKKEELKVANKRFKMAMKASSEMIWDWDIVNDHVTRSKSFHKDYGYDLKETRSMNSFWLPKVHEEDQPCVQRSIQDALDNPQLKKWKGEYRFVKANGKMAHVIDRAYISRDEKGKAIRMVGSVLDVTAQQKALRKIKTQNKILKEIAWEQSHVVRAPLARIKALMQLMELEAFEEMSREEIWKNISTSADELDDIVKGIVQKTTEIKAKEAEPVGRMEVSGN